MAGTLLHITLSNLALQRAVLPRSARRDIEQEIDNFHLGAVLFDLPYYEHLLFQGIVRASGRDYRYGDWGTKLHRRSPAGFCLRLLRAAETPSERATALGALTHAAVDMVFHPEIEERVTRTEAGRARPNRMHHMIETQMDLYLHHRIIGGPGIGSPYTAQALNLRPDSSWIDHFLGAVCFVHGESPSGRRARSWLRGIHRFRLLHCRPAAWVSTAVEPDAERDASTNRLLERSLAQAAQYLELGWEAAHSESNLAILRRTLSDIDLVRGDAALPSLGEPF